MNYFIEYFDLFSSVYFTKDNQCIAVPELWRGVDWDDSNYKQIRKYVSTNYHTDVYNSTFLYVNDMAFFNTLRGRYFTIFIGVPINYKEVVTYNDFFKHSLYQDVLDNLVFLGWNPKCSIGSALTDGIYPIKLVDNRILKIDISVNVNKFGLIENEDDCLYICKLNNESYEYNEGDFWYPTKIFVDRFTYAKIK